MTELAGKVAIVTGASRGIGLAAAMALAGAGASVMVVARDGLAASRAAEAVVAGGGRALGVSCDVADYAAVEAMVDDTSRRFGKPDILVNNAGVIEPIGALAQSDPATWARNINVNLIGSYNAIRATLPHMLRTGDGTVINVSSGAAHRPLEGWGAYCSAKAGLAMLTAALAVGGAGFRLGARGDRYRHAGHYPGSDPDRPPARFTRASFPVWLDYGCGSVCFRPIVKPHRSCSWNKCPSAGLSASFNPASKPENRSPSAPSEQTEVDRR